MLFVFLLKFEFCSILKCLEIDENFDFLGKSIQKEVIQKISYCIIHPITKIEFKDIYQIKKNWISLKENLMLPSILPQ